MITTFYDTELDLDIYNILTAAVSTLQRQFASSSISVIELEFRAHCISGPKSGLASGVAPGSEFGLGMEHHVGVSTAGT